MPFCLSLERQRFWGLHESLETVVCVYISLSSSQEETITLPQSTKWVAPSLFQFVLCSRHSVRLPFPCNVWIKVWKSTRPVSEYAGRSHKEVSPVPISISGDIAWCQKWDCSPSKANCCENTSITTKDKMVYFKPTFVLTLTILGIYGETVEMGGKRYSST